MSERLMTVAEAAGFCRISVWQMYRLAERGEVASVRIGASVRIDPADLREWLSGRRSITRNEIRRIAANKTLTKQKNKELWNSLIELSSRATSGA